MTKKKIPTPKEIPQFTIYWWYQHGCAFCQEQQRAMNKFQPEIAGRGLVIKLNLAKTPSVFGVEPDRTPFLLFVLDSQPIHSCTGLLEADELNEFVEQGIERWANKKPFQYENEEDGELDDDEDDDD
jgi:thioredoxin-like negative regulator of GroEL